MSAPLTRSLHPTTADPARFRGSATAALAAALLGFFVITLDCLAVNVALPDIRIDLGGGMTGLQWVMDGYTLMFAALLLSAGALSDRAGARRTAWSSSTASISAGPAGPVLVHNGPGLSADDAAVRVRERARRAAG